MVTLNWQATAYKIKLYKINIINVLLHVGFKQKHKTQNTKYPGSSIRRLKKIYSTYPSRNSPSFI